MITENNLICPDCLQRMYCMTHGELCDHWRIFLDKRNITPFVNNWSITLGTNKMCFTIHPYSTGNFPQLDIKLNGVITFEQSISNKSATGIIDKIERTPIHIIIHAIQVS